MSTKIAALVSVLALVVAGSAFAQDYRSPDAKPAVVTQDYRSPDAGVVGVNPSSGFIYDLRSPDARPSGQFSELTPTPASSSDGFDWGWIALGIGITAAGIAALAMTERRRHHLVVGH
jgi:hypothetical protein